MCSFARRLSLLCIACLNVGLLTLTAPVVVAQGSESGDTLFAPGVLTTIDPEIDPSETLSVHDVVELSSQRALERDPKFDAKSRTLIEMAKGVDFRRDVWCLELAFKPLRMVYVDVPQPTAKMQRKLIWYLVYRIRNTGVALGPDEQRDGSFTTASVEPKPQRFIPQFVLASQDRNRRGDPIRKAYLDRLLPAAMPVIQRRELSEGKLLNSVEIAELMLEPESGRTVNGVWGVAIWEDVDPSIDFFSVYVGGLTNAYKWQDADDFQAGDPAGKGRKFFRKTLQLNFWRPGDTVAENEREIRFGVAPGYAEYYGVTEGVAYRWLYR